MNIAELVFLGAVAGFTIYLGLPLARVRSVSPRLKGMLNSMATGILIFLLVDILGHALEATEGIVLASLSGTTSLLSGLLYLAVLIGGLAVGLLGLVWFEGRFIKAESEKRGGKVFSLDKAKRIALMIAIGIGLHNFSEGLAIGQSYASGEFPLAILLVIGFGLHNATEGFGIAAPLSGYRPSWRFIALLGLIGGGPTFLGAIIGSFWVSPLISVLFLALAAGAIIYVLKELLYHGRIHGEGLATMSFLVLGFFAGFATDLVIKYAIGG